MDIRYLCQCIAGSCINHAEVRNSNRRTPDAGRAISEFALPEKVVVRKAGLDSNLVPHTVFPGYVHEQTGQTLQLDGFFLRRDMMAGNS